jgi:hypothetical protein
MEVSRGLSHASLGFNLTYHVVYWAAKAPPQGTASFIRQILQLPCREGSDYAAALRVALSKLQTISRTIATRILEPFITVFILCGSFLSSPGRRLSWDSSPSLQLFPQYQR